MVYAGGRRPECEWASAARVQSKTAVLPSQLRVTGLLNRFVVVVDEDIDPMDINDVIWAMSFRTNPASDIDIIRNTWSGDLDPLIRKPSKDLHNSRAIINACKPFAWIDEFPKVVKASPELTEKTKKKWGAKLLGDAKAPRRRNRKS